LTSNVANAKQRDATTRRRASKKPAGCEVVERSKLKMIVPMSSKNQVLTALELAQYLRIHPTTVYKLAKRGDLPAFKVGGDWRFNRASIEKWLEGRKNRFPDNFG
jgi:excisionase family DNA binding protein